MKKWNGEKLKKVAKLREITYVAIAKNIGVSKASISYWVSGETQPKANSLFKLASLLLVDINYFYDDV